MMPAVEQLYHRSRLLLQSDVVLNLPGFFRRLLEEKSEWSLAEHNTDFPWEEPLSVQLDLP